MNYLRSVLFYLIQFAVLLTFALINLYFIDSGVVVNVVIILFMIIYFSLRGNTLAFKLCDYKYKPISKNITAQTFGVLVTICLSYIMIVLLMHDFYPIVIGFFIVELLLDVFNNLTITEFITLSRKEMVEEL